MKEGGGLGGGGWNLGGGGLCCVSYFISDMWVVCVHMNVINT